MVRDDQRREALRVAVEACVDAGFTRQQTQAIQLMVSSQCTYNANTKRVQIGAVLEVIMQILQDKGVVSNEELIPYVGVFKKALDRDGA